MRYEDLIRDPEHTMRGLLDRLGADWDPAALEHHEQKGPSRDDRKFPQNTRANRAVDTRSVRRWESELSDEELNYITWAAGDLLKELGY